MYVERVWGVEIEAAISNTNASQPPESVRDFVDQQPNVAAVDFYKVESNEEAEMDRRTKHH